MNSNEVKPKHQEESALKSVKTTCSPNRHKLKKNPHPTMRYGDMDISKVIIKR